MNQSPKIFSFLSAIAAAAIAAVDIRQHKWFFAAIWALITFFAAGSTLGKTEFRTYGSYTLGFGMAFIFGVGSVASLGIGYLMAFFPGHTDKVVLALAFSMYCGVAAAEHFWLIRNND